MNKKPISSSPRKRQFTVGLDLGGTKLAAALCDDQGRILAFRKESITHLKSDPKKGPKLITELMGQMADSFRVEFPEAFVAKSFKGVGLASAGPLNVDEGKLIRPSNFPGWINVPIRQLLVENLKQQGIRGPVHFQNDAIAAAFAEGWVGGAKGLQSYAVVTIGTGIGSGVIFRGIPLQTNGMGSEFGHVIAQSGQIRKPQDLERFTVEGLASGTGILRRARDIGFAGHSMEELVMAMDKGETRYQDLFDVAAESLAALCFNLSIGINPQKILFSGGLIKVRKLYWQRLQSHYKMLIETFNPAFKCPLVVAQAKNKAGVIGAASLPFRLKSVL